ncbi:hypothetical protein ACMFY5_12390 [Pseudomonas sihuiensis]
MSTDVRDLLQGYFNALNDRDIRACLALVSDELILQPNQGLPSTGATPSRLFWSGSCIAIAR